MKDIYWWSRKKSEKSLYENFGDALVPFIVSRITNEKFRRVDPNTARKYRIFKKKHYFIIGSVLRMATTHTIVWGAGIIKKDAEVKKAFFLLVRGPITRNRLLELGYKVPERYGDPALLLRLFYKKKEDSSGIIGVIPHYVDHEDVYELYNAKKPFRIIDMSTNDPQEVIDRIVGCDFVISSSLHGIIVAHALGIPAAWMKVSERLYGDDVKFYDYFKSVGISSIRNIPFKYYSEKEILKIFQEKSCFLPSKVCIDERLKDLIYTCPFEKSKEFNSAIETYFN